jgi:hypothetical protein
MPASLRTHFLAIPAAVSILALSAAGAAAFECPKHFTAAQTMIDKVKGDMGGDMSKKMPKDQMALVHALLDDAKMLLAGAKHNHEKPQGAYDHGRSIAKADAARGSALAADLLHFKMMQM